MIEVECGLQTIRKTGLLAVLMSLVLPVWAEEEGDALVDPGPVFHREAGNIKGYSPVALGDDTLPATLIPEQLGEPRGKILILHDSDGGIAGSGLVDTLRLSLPASGWTTMTVELHYPQSPQLFLAESADAADADPAAAATDNETETTTPQNNDNDSAPTEAEPVDNSARIRAALAYLNAQQPGPVVIVALGESAPLALSAASQQGEDKAQIWIAAEMTLTELPELGPLLDITTQALGNENAAAKSREVFMRQANNQAYSQRSLLGAGHDFQGFETQVLTIVRAWLQKQFDKEVQG